MPMALSVKEFLAAVAQRRKKKIPPLPEGFDDIGADGYPRRAAFRKKMDEAFFGRTPAERKKRAKELERQRKWQEEFEAEMIRQAEADGDL